MSYRNRETSQRNLAKKWLATRRDTLIKVGLSQSLLNSPDDFFHDFLLHGYRLPRDLTAGQVESLLRLVTDDWTAYVRRSELCKALAERLGPNVILRTRFAKWSHRRLVPLRTSFGDTFAMLCPSADDELMEARIVHSELVWEGQEFLEYDWDESESRCFTDPHGSFCVVSTQCFGWREV